MELLAEEGRIDLALTLVKPEAVKGGAFFHSKTLFSEPYTVAMAYDHHLSKSPSVSLSDLENEPFIARSHCEYRRVLQELIRSSGVQLDVAYVTNQDDRALTLVKGKRPVIPS